jgi:hypothetical protein
MNVSADNKKSSSVRSRHIAIALVAAALLVLLGRFLVDWLLPPQPNFKPIALQALARGVSAHAASLPAVTDEDVLVTEQVRQARIEHERNAALEAKFRRDQKLQAAIASRDQASEIIRLDQERMDQAWANFYKKPKKCDNPSDQSVIVECGNHFIREKQRFEKLWADGKISPR